jgi:alanine racemase
MVVSLDNYRYNYRAIRDYVSGSKVIAVVKANAYGIGAIPAVWALKAEGADFFAVGTPDEAVELREAGVLDSLLVLGASPYEAAGIYVRLGVSATITDLPMAEAMSRAAVRLGAPARVHLKVDSGMGRLGFLPDASLRAAEEISGMPGVELEGVLTHFASSDEEDLSHTWRQFMTFSSVVRSIKDAGIAVPIAHCSNSGSIMAGLSEMFMDAVRPGHILSGVIPTPECRDGVRIKPCFEVKTAIAAIRDLPPGSGVSYGLTYTTRETERIAILPVGYGDGYSRVLSNAGHVLIGGKRCPVRGRVCMDQCVADISRVQNAKVGDEAVLVGRQGGEAITMEEMAELLSVNAASVPLSFTARIPREYI